jgi:hypothetical protein
MKSGRCWGPRGGPADGTKGYGTTAAGTSGAGPHGCVNPRGY